MRFSNLEKQFGRMGARIAVRNRPDNFAVDIGRDASGSWFDLSVSRRTLEVAALDVQPRQRHLLLVVREEGTFKYLCGHDERDWFAAAVPVSGSVTNVRQAMDALKPSEVTAAERRLGVKGKRRYRRRNAAFVRQGEWFFLPQPELVVDLLFILRNEPLRRGRGKPHTAEQLIRTGGERVYVCDKYPRGISERRYQQLVQSDPAKKAWRWTVLQRNPRAYVRGTVRHADHKTIRLDVWHRVLTNTEDQAPGMRHLYFLD